MFLLDYFQSEQAAFLKSVYQLPLVDPGSDIDETIRELIPQEEIGILDSHFKSWNEITKALSLNQEQRTPLLQKISYVIKKKNDSKSITFYSTLVFRSALYLLFTPMEEIDINEYYNTMTCIFYAFSMLNCENELKSKFITLWLQRVEQKPILDYLMPISQLLMEMQYIAKQNAYLAFKIANKIMSDEINLLATNDQVTFNSFLMSFISFLHEVAVKKDLSKYLGNIYNSICRISTTSRELISTLFDILLIIMNSNINIQMLIDIANCVAAKPPGFILKEKNKSAPIIQMPTTQILGFHNVPEFEVQNKNIEPSHSFLEVEHMINNPFLSIANSLARCRFCVSHPTLFKLIAAILQQIASNKLHQIILLHFIISINQNHRKEIEMFLTQNNIWHYLINRCFYASSVNLYINPDSDIICLRHTMFEIVSMLITMPESLIQARKALLDILRSITQDTLLFSEILLMTYPSLKDIFTKPQVDDDLFDVFFQAIVIGQHRHIFGEKLSAYYRPLMLSVLSSILQSPHSMNLVLKSMYSCVSLCSILFETTFMDQTINDLRAVVNQATENEQLINMTAALHQVFLALTPIVATKNAENLYFELLQFFMRILKGKNLLIAGIIINSSLLADICSIAIKLPPTSDKKYIFDTLLQILFNLQFSPHFNSNNIPYAALGNQLNSIGVDEETYKLIMRIVGGSTESFSKIAQPESLPLLMFAFKNTERYNSVLDNLLDICQDSICNRCSCLIGGVVQFIFEHFDDDNYEKTLKLFEYISMTICSKASLFAFIRHFSKFEGKTLNKYVMPSLKTLINILLKAKDSEQSALIQFSSSLSCCRAPNISYNDIKYGFLFETMILVDDSRGERVLFEIGNGVIRIACILDKSEISLCTVDESGNVFQNTMRMEVPYGRFFKLSLFFTPNKYFSVFVDQNFERGMTLNRMNIDDSTIFNSNLLFKSLSTSSTQLQVKAFRLRTYEIVGQKIPDPKPEEFPEEMTRFIYQYNNGTFNKNQIKLQTMNGDIRINYRGLGIPFACSFIKIFEASHSIDFIISLFGQSNLQEAVECNLFRQLTEIFARLVDNSQTITYQLYDNNGFDVIAYFLDDLPPKQLDAGLWHLFVVTFSILRAPELKKQYCSAIIYNLDVWKKADPVVQARIIKDIKFISLSNVTIFTEYLKAPTLIKYLSSVMDNSTKELIGNIVDLIGYSVSLVFDVNEQHVIFAFINSCQNYSISVAIINVLEPVKQYLNNNEEYCALFMHPSEDVRLAWLQIYLSIDHNEKMDKISIFSLISNYQISLCVEDDSSKSFLVHALAKAYGYNSQTSISQIISQEEILMKDYIAFVFAILSLNFAPQSLALIAISTIQRSLHSSENIQFILSKISILDIFIFLYFMLTIGRNLTKEFAFLVDTKEMFETVMGALDTMAVCGRIDLEEFRLQLIENIFDNLIRKYDQQTQIDIEDSIIQSLLFHRKLFTTNHLVNEYNNSIFADEKFENEEQFLKPENLFTIFLRVSEKSSSYDYSFGLYFKDGSRWLYKTFARKLLYGIYAVLTEKNIPAFESFYYLMYAFFCMDTSRDDISNLAPILTEIFNATMKEDPKLYILLLFLQSFANKDISFPSKIIENYRNELSSNKPKEETMKLLIDFSSRKPDWLKRCHLELSTLISQMMKRHTYFLVPMSLDVESELNKCLQDFAISFNRRQAEHNWRRLWQSMTFTNNPSLSTSVKSHYKRGKLIGNDFCPILLTRNTEFSIHAEALRAAVEGDDQEEADDELPSHFVFKYESRKKIPEIPQIKNTKFNAPCDNYKIGTKTSGAFYVYNDRFTFIAEDRKCTTIYFSDVKYIFWMTVMHRPTAIEIFTNKSSFFYNFPTLQDRNPIMKHIISNNFPNAIFIQTKSGSNEVVSLGLTHKWVTRQISTFTYLMWLNQLSCRSFNNTQNYPVFPWILKDYSSKNIDLTNGDVYRDLSKPIGALNAERLRKLKINVDTTDGETPILYRSTYSCPFHIYFWMLRMEPYTTMHIEIQDGHFDVPGRLFANMAYAWNSASGFMNNFKELIPEFYFLPEFLMNIDHFKFGKMMSGEVVDDVVLPPYSSNAVSFVLMNREALESDTVSQTIGQWIDLIWGYAQSGPQSVIHDNVFDPRLYEDVWDKYTDPDFFPEIESMLMNVGVIPNKLFDEKHPQREPKQKHKTTFIVYKANIEIIAVTTIGSIIYALTPSGEIFSIGQSNQSVLKLTSSVIAAYPSKSPFFTILLSDAKSVALVYEKKMNITYNTEHIDSITCVCNCNETLFTGGKDGLLIDWKNKKSVMSHSETVMCVDANETQNIVATCGSDGKLSINIACPLKFVRTVNMTLPEGLLPQQISIGDNGIIAVISGHMSDSICGEHLSLFTINGTKFYENNIAAVAVQVCVLKDGTTLIAIAAHDNSICLYRAYNMRLIDVILRCDSFVTMMKYESSSESIYVATKQGTLTICRL